MLKSLKIQAPNRRIVLAFDPKNASSRRNIFMDEYSEALSQADCVFIAPCPQDNKISENNKMRTQDLAEKIGSKALAFQNYQDLFLSILGLIKEKDLVIFMSCGDFAQLPSLLIEKLSINPGQENSLKKKERLLSQ